MLLVTTVSLLECLDNAVLPGSYCFDWPFWFQDIANKVLYLRAWSQDLDWVQIHHLLGVQPWVNSLFYDALFFPPTNETVVITYDYYRIKWNSNLIPLEYC